MFLEDRIKSIPGRLNSVLEHIEVVATDNGRDPSSVRLVAVTKSFPVEIVRASLEAGLTDIGENRVQEATGKIEELGRECAVWHLVGHLQTNKAKHAVRYFDIVESVDSFRIAEALNQRAQVENLLMQVLIQVNTSGEESKFGVSAGELKPLLEKVSTLDNIEVQGLMTIAPFDTRDAVVRPAFVGLRKLLEKAGSWNIPRVEMKHLSMGMSNDYKWAVAEGATMIRLGSVLFGPRK